MNNIQDKNISKTTFNITNLLQQTDQEILKREVLQSLLQKQKSISSKFFYDLRGSELFERITHLQEYYPSKAEKSIIAKLYPQLNFDFTNANIIELGSGDPSKISLLFKQIPDNILKTIKYYPVDISLTAIEKSGLKLTNDFTLKSINGIVADFYKQLNFFPENGKNIICFFGSTLGNFSPVEQKQFLQAISSKMKNDDLFLLGLDTVKKNDILEKAYNDEAGITAAFNKNILLVVNKILDTKFDITDFEHLAFYNIHKKRIEMHLKAKKDIKLSVPFYDKFIYIKKGESIHTENSYKFSFTDLNLMAENSALKISDIFNAQDNLFCLSVLQKK